MFKTITIKLKAKNNPNPTIITGIKIKIVLNPQSQLVNKASALKPILTKQLKNPTKIALLASQLPPLKRLKGPLTSKSITSEQIKIELITKEVNSQG